MMFVSHFQVPTGIISTSCHYITVPWQLFPSLSFGFILIDHNLGIVTPPREKQGYAGTLGKCESDCHRQCRCLHQSEPTPLAQPQILESHILNSSPNREICHSYPAFSFVLKGLALKGTLYMLANRPHGTKVLIASQSRSHHCWVHFV